MVTDVSQERQPTILIKINRLTPRANGRLARFDKVRQFSTQRPSSLAPAGSVQTATIHQFNRQGGNMPFASDQKSGSDNPTYLSARMLELEEVVFEMWERRVRSTVKLAETVEHPILIDTLPALYRNLAQALTPGHPRTSAAVATPSVATEHGGERARVTPYNTEAVIAEYQILKLTILDVLEENGVPVSNIEKQIIDSSIDAAIREGATAFTLAQAALREQSVATLAHDLRTPLGIAHAAVQLILKADDRTDRSGYAAQALENLDRVDQMVREMLDTVIFNKGQRLQLDGSNFDMRSLVDEVVEECATIYGQRFEVLGDSVVGWWGRHSMKRALENLISNAVKYGSPTTPVRIAVAQYHGRIELSVHNEGPPIPPDQVETMFQVFRRARAAKEPNQEGWGIGLPYVRSVAESHGGSLDVDSSEVRGTTVTIDVPLDSRPFQNSPTLSI